MPTILYCILLLCLTLIQHQGWGQQPLCLLEIKGRVIDVSDGQPLAYATIYIQESGTGTTTLENGEFLISHVCPGNVHAVVSHVGCPSQTFFIHVTKDTFFTWSLDHHATVLDAIEINAIHTKSRAGQSHFTLGQEAMLETGSHSISELASRVPGVRILRTGPGLGKPVVNGFTGNRISLLQDGIPLESQQWGNDHAPELDAATGDKVTVSVGAESVRYGASSLGGAISVEPILSGFDPHWHGLVRTIIQSNGRKMGLQTMLKRKTGIGRLRLTGGGFLGGDQSTPDYFLTNTGQRSQSASILLANSEKARHQRHLFLSYYASEQGLLAGAHPGSLTDLADALTRMIPFRTRDTFSFAIQAPKQTTKHFLLSVDQKFTLDERRFIKLKAGWQANLRKEFDIRRAGRDARPALDLFLWSQFYDVALVNELAKQAGQWQAGVQYKYTNNTNLPGTGISPIIPDYIQQQLALYAIRQWKAASWQYEIGARAEARWIESYLVQPNQTIALIQNKFNLFACNAGIKKEVSETALFRTDLSITFRPPDVNELFSQGLHQGVSGIEEGNPTLRTEKAFRLGHEWQVNAGKMHSLHASVFYQYIDNFIYLKPDSVFRLTVRGAFPVYKYTSDDVSISGANLTYSLSASEHWSFSQQAEYIYATNLSTQEGLIRMPPFIATSTIQYHNGNVSWCKEIKGVIEGRYTARQTHVSLAEDFLAPPPGFWLLNGMVRIKWKYGSGKELDVILRMENMFNIQYRDYLNRLRYFADETGRNWTMTVQYPF